jgi:hypothetical protein
MTDLTPIIRPPVTLATVTPPTTLASETPPPPVEPLDLAFDLWRSALLAQGIALTWFWGFGLMLARSIHSTAHLGPEAP